MGICIAGVAGGSTIPASPLDLKLNKLSLNPWLWGRHFDSETVLGAFSARAKLLVLFQEVHLAGRWSVANRWSLSWLIFGVRV